MIFIELLIHVYVFLVSSCATSTAGIRNSGFRAKTKVSAFNKSLCQTESEVLFNPLLLIHANRYNQF
jgi:hypothetical protein